MIVVHPSGAVMLGFLIITSLSLAFYLGLLFFLYRDGRKRRPSGGSVYKVQAGSVAELPPLPTMVYRRPSSRRQNAVRELGPGKAEVASCSPQGSQGRYSWDRRSRQ